VFVTPKVEDSPAVPNEQGVVTGIGFEKQQPADDKDMVLPVRHMSDRQVVDIARRELPLSLPLRSEFKVGVWEISEVQKDAWGVLSVATNAEGRIFITSTNATRLLLTVRDADGKAEQVKTP
jgi:hypothetical protein